MRELLSLHIGQAGVQMGNAMWELLCTEHGINEDGHPGIRYNSENNNETFFKISSEKKYVPRCLFVDLEPTVIDEIRIGSFKTLFHPENLISGPEDAANNFARGFFTVGKLILCQIEGQIRKLFESCDSVQAVIIYRSLGGGTGAGLTSAMFEGLSEYPKSLKIEIPIYPSPRLTSSTVEPYNCLLGEHFCMEDTGLGIMVDNEALFDITTKFLHTANASFTAINRLVSHIMSNLTASLRFQCVCSSDVTVLQNNLVPYPRIHYPVCNISPLIAHKTGPFEAVTIKDMTQMLFQRDNQLIKIDQSVGKYMSCVLFYRGNINICDVYDSLFEIKKSKFIHFVDWCPTGFKVGINLSLPTFVPDGFLPVTDKNVVMLTNTSSIGQAWQRLTHKFYLLYSKRSFVHWFVGEGMEECEFTESLYNLSSLVKDYEEVAAPTDLSQITSSKDKDTRLTENVNSDAAVNPYENVSLYVSMTNGIPVSAPDRGSLLDKKSLMKSGYNKSSLNPEHSDLLVENKISGLQEVKEEMQENDFDTKEENKKNPFSSSEDNNNRTDYQSNNIEDVHESNQKIDYEPHKVSSSENINTQPETNSQVVSEDNLRNETENIIEENENVNENVLENENENVVEDDDLLMNTEYNDNFNSNANEYDYTDSEEDSNDYLLNGLNRLSRRRF